MNQEPMSEEFYLSQIKRLQIHFGAKAFNSESVRVFGKEVVFVSDEFFRNTVDTWIGARKTSNPPLLPDFREAKLTFERNNLKRECRQATVGFNNGLKEVLRRVYKVDTIEEAFEIEQLKLRMGDKDGQGGST